MAVSEGRARWTELSPVIVEPCEEICRIPIEVRPSVPIAPDNIWFIIVDQFLQLGLRNHINIFLGQPEMQFILAEKRIEPFELGKVETKFDTSDLGYCLF